MAEIVEYISFNGDPLSQFLSDVEERCGTIGPEKIQAIHDLMDHPELAFRVDYEQQGNQVMVVFRPSDMLLQLAK